MGMMALGLVLVMAGIALALTSLVVGLAGATPLLWVGWVALAVGVVLAMLSLAARSRRKVGRPRTSGPPGP